jgi:hypothetical protein
VLALSIVHINMPNTIIKDCLELKVYFYVGCHNKIGSEEKKIASFFDNQAESLVLTLLFTKYFGFFKTTC